MMYNQINYEFNSKLREQLWDNLMTAPLQNSIILRLWNAVRNPIEEVVYYSSLLSELK